MPAFECETWEIKLLQRLRQLRERRAARQVLLDLQTLRLCPVGNPEILDRVGVGTIESPLAFKETLSIE